MEEGTKEKPHVRKFASFFLISATLGRQVHDPKTFFSPTPFSYDVPPVLTPAPTIAVVMRRPGTIRPSDARGACCVLLFVLSPPPLLIPVLSYGVASHPLTVRIRACLGMFYLFLVSDGGTRSACAYPTASLSLLLVFSRPFSFGGRLGGVLFTRVSRCV